MTTRRVTGIGDEHRPDTALTKGVQYSESRWRVTLDGGAETITHGNRAYLDTFANWARREVKT